MEFLLITWLWGCRLFYCFLFLFCFVFAQEHVDGVIAVVDDKVILKSDILEQTMMLARQKQINPTSRPLVFEELFKRVLDDKIDKFVVLAIANQDTLVEVGFDDVNNSLEDRINLFVDVFGSKEALEDTMNMKIKEIKADYWQIVKNELLIEKYRQLYFNDISINKQEVLSFFSNNPDSFPSPPLLVDFSLLESPVVVSVTTKDSLFMLCESLIDSLSLGLLDFSVAAKRYSQDPGSSSNGGLLGYTKRGSLLPKYEKAAFSLSPGDVVGPIETVFGYHIIKLVDRVGEKINSQHILFTLSPGPVDVKKTSLTLENHKKKFYDDPASFDSLALTFFDLFSNLSGYYVDYEINQLPVFLQKKLSNTTPFSFSDVFYNDGGVYLLYKYQTKQDKKLTIIDDWYIIEQIALQNKKTTVFKEWIKKKRDRVYVKVFTF